MNLPWLLLLVIGLAAAPVGACVWWLVHSRREQERKQLAMTKMTRLYVTGPDRGPITQPLHALADGDNRPYGVRRHPASWPSGASHIEVPPRMQEPALSMIAGPGL